MKLKSNYWNHVVLLFLFLILIFSSNSFSQENISGQLSMEKFMIGKFAGEKERGFSKVPEYAMAYKPFGASLQSRCFDGIDNNNNAFIDCANPDCFMLEGTSCIECEKDVDCGLSSDLKAVSCIQGKCISLLSYSSDISLAEDRAISCGPCGKAVKTPTGFKCEKDEDYLKNMFKISSLSEELISNLNLYGFSEDSFSCFDNYVTCDATRNISVLGSFVEYFDYKITDGCCIDESVNDSYYCSEFHKLEPLVCMNTISPTEEAVVENQGSGFLSGENNNNNNNNNKFETDVDTYDSFLLNNGYCGCYDGSYVLLNMNDFMYSDAKYDSLTCSDTYEFLSGIQMLGKDNFQYFVLNNDFKNALSFEVEESLSKDFSFKTYSDVDNTLEISLYSLNKDIFYGFSPKQVGFLADTFEIVVNSSITYFKVPFNLEKGSYVLKFELLEDTPVYISEISLLNESYVFVDSKRPAFSKTSYSQYESETGLCPKDWCWNGVTCYPDVSQSPFIKPSIREVNGSGYRCVKGEWIYSELKFDPTYSYQGYCEKQDSCLLSPHNSINCGNPLNDSREIAFCNKDSNESFICYDLDGYEIKPQCIDNGRSVENDVCVDGTWVSKTAYDVELLRELSVDSNYVLYCDDYEKVLDSSNYDNSHDFKPWVSVNPNSYNEKVCYAVKKDGDSYKSYLIFNYNLNEQFYFYESLLNFDFVPNLFGKNSLDCELDDLSYEDKFNWHNCLNVEKRNKQINLLINPFKGKALFMIGDVISGFKNPFSSMGYLYGVDFLALAIESKIRDLDSEVLSFKVEFEETSEDNKILTYDGVKNNYDVYYYNNFFDDEIEASVVNDLLFVSKYDFGIWSSMNDLSMMYIKYPSISNINFCDELSRVFEDEFNYDCEIVSDSNYMLTSNDTELFSKHFLDLTAKIRVDGEIW